MERIEVNCGHFPKFIIKFPENLSAQDLAWIQEKALEIVYQCNKRSLGSDCFPRCPMPRIALAEPGEIKKAVEEVAQSPDVSTLSAP